MNLDFSCNWRKNKEPTSGLEPLTCSLRVSYSIPKERPAPPILSSHKLDLAPFRLLRAQEWLPLVAAAPRLPALEDRLRVVQEMAHRRNVGASEHRAARALAGTTGEKPAAQRRNSRFTISQDERGGRRSTGLRRRKEGSRQEASSVGGHRGVSAQDQGPQRQGTRSGRYQVGVGDRT